jgi:hypothetical protein
MKTRIQQYDMAIDLHSRRLLSGFKIRNVDVAQIGDVREVQAHGFAEEHLQGHVLDSFALRSEMEVRVNMSPRMSNHAEELDRGCEPVVGRS